MAELAAWYEDSAAEEPDPGRRSLLLRRAATLYRERAGRPEAAAAALLAARSAAPDDLDLTAQAARTLYFNDAAAQSYQAQIARAASIWNSSVTNVRLVETSGRGSFSFREGNDSRGSYASTGPR